MKNLEQPAFTIQPYSDFKNDLKDRFAAYGGINPTGLTKIEYASIMAMQGLIASSGGEYDDWKVAKSSISIATELLTQLEQK